MSVALRNIQIANSVPTIGHEVGRSEPSLDSSAAACRIVVMLFPGFSLLSLSSILAPFEKANSICETSKFKWTLASASGASEATNLGIVIPTTATFSDLHPGNGSAFAMDLCVLVGGHEAIEAPASVAATVRKCVRQGIPIAALGGAVWLLAELGVLNEGTCTIHWEQMASLAETFETFSVTDAIFEESKGIWTCAGEAASFDLGMALMQTMLGTDLTRDVCKLLLVDGIRTESFRQTGFIPWNLPGIGHKLTQAVHMMARHLDEPLTLEQLSAELAISRRQMERLFENHLGTSPHRFYLKLRLDRAKQLIEGTKKSLVDVAVACGFVSSAHFSKCYREQFGCSPTITRRSRSARAARKLEHGVADGT